jgi:hypothetical protein
MSTSFIGTGADTLTFANVGVGDWYIDDIIVSAVSAPTSTKLPEPATLALFSAGIAGAFAMGRRKKKAIEGIAASPQPPGPASATTGRYPAV